MNRETYEIGEEVKIYLVGPVVRGTVVNVKEVAMEVDDLHFSTTMLYLVLLSSGHHIFALEQFMRKVKKAK